MESLPSRYFHADERKGFLVIWAIDHFPHWYLGPANSPLDSDLLYCLDGTRWRLQLLRKDRTVEISLVRQCPDDGPEKLDVGFRIFLVDVPLQTLPKVATFRKDSKVTVVVDAEVFSTSALEDDTVLLRCHLWRSRKGIVAPSGCKVGVVLKMYSTISNFSFEVFPKRLKTPLAQSPTSRQTTEKSDRGFNFLLSYDQYHENPTDDPDVELRVHLTHRRDVPATYRLRTRLLDVDGRPSPALHLFTRRDERWSFPSLSLLPRRLLEEGLEEAGLVRVNHEADVVRLDNDLVVLDTIYQYERSWKMMGPDLEADLRTCLREGWSTDLTLTTDDGHQEQVHRALVCAHSSVFAAMMEHDMAERRSGRVRIADMDGRTLTSFVTFLYCGTLDSEEELSCETLAGLYAAGDKYEVLSLKRTCGDLLKERVTPENAFDVLDFSDLHSDAGLRDAAVGVIHRKTRETLGTDEWKKRLRRSSSPPSSS